MPPWGMDEASIDRFRAALAGPVSTKDIVRKVVCGCCDALLTEDESTIKRYSGIVNFDENMCKGCRKEFGDQTRIVCLRCKALRAFYKPQTSKTGFVFQPRSAVHIEKCHVCVPGTVATPVLEHLQFCRSQRIPTNVDADIVQEAERNALQGDLDAAKLRAELQGQLPTS